MKRRRTALLLAIVTLLVSTIAGILPIGAGTAQESAQNGAPFTVTLTLEDTRFEPNVLKIPANQDVIIRLKNVGAALHDFVIPGREIAVEVQPGESTEVTVNLPLGGYSFSCSVPGHKESGMVGTLLVETSGAFAPAVSPSPTVFGTSVSLPQEATQEVETPTPQASAVATATPEESPVALDDPGCEGLSAYSKQVLSIESDAWNQLVAEFGIAEETDLFFLEAGQFADFAKMLDAEAALLGQVEAPAFAEDWHQSRIASKQLGAATARLIPEAGSAFAAELMLWEVSEILDAQRRQAYLDAVAACPAFEAFWSELDMVDGDSGDPPQAPPDYASCAGLEEYDANLRRAGIQAMANVPDAAEEFFEVVDLDEDELEAIPPVELIMLSQLFEEFGDEVAAVTPPTYALEWHLAQGFWYDLYSSYWLAAAGSGFDSADEELGMQSGLIAMLEEGAIESATEECAIFAEFAAS